MQVFAPIIENDDAPCHCFNCNWRGPASAARPIKDPSERIGAGEVVPAGECPECGALAGLDEIDRPQDRAAEVGPALTAFPPPAPRDAIGLRDPYVARCAEETGPDLVGAILRAAWDFHGCGFGSKSRAAFDAWARLSSAFVAYNGAPFGFRGPLTPDQPPIESFPRGAALESSIAAEHVPGTANHFRLNAAGQAAVAEARATDPRTAPHGVPQAVASGAGYRVERQPEGGFYVVRPNGEESHVALNTEREAWESAFADHERRHPRPGEFSKAILAGYDVEPNGFSAGGWIARNPNGDEIEAAGDRDAAGNTWATERAAWEACDRHRTGATPTTRAAVSGDDFPV